MTPSRWTRRIFLRTLLIVGLAIGMAIAASYLVFTYEETLWLFSIVGISAIIIVISLVLGYVLLFDDIQNEKNPDDFSWRRP